MLRALLSSSSLFILNRQDCTQFHSRIMPTLETAKNISRPVIAGNPSYSVFKLGPKYDCEKHASNNRSILRR